MSAALQHTAIMDDNNQVRMLDGGQPMGYNYAGSSLLGAIQGFLDDLLNQYSLHMKVCGRVHVEYVVCKWRCMYVYMSRVIIVFRHNNY